MRLLKKRPTIHLVMGISSVGKSSYIAAKRHSGEWRSLPVIMAYELENKEADHRLQHECVVHYNLFRPLDNSIDHIENDLLSDPALRKLLEHGTRIQAYVLVAPRSTILQRALLREQTEPLLNDELASYPSHPIIELICHIDLSEYYRRWLALLQDRAIRYKTLDASNEDYRRISSDEIALGLLSESRHARYSDENVARVLSNNLFEYQRMEVRAGLFTPGQDRTDLLQFLDADLTGKSLLDVGCAYGYFCFEAEKRNASRVVGTELMRHRFVGANILKELLGMKAELRYQDIFKEPLHATFDVVLFLNVIHHLKEPVAALRQLAHMCSDTLIIEFPTLSDGKFQSTLPNPAKLDSGLPLIGVSLLGAQDQTFLFSKAAIKRILLDHDRLFTQIDFHPSTMSAERCVAICRK